MVFGPARTFAYYREWDELVRRPALTEHGDQTRAIELTDIPASDSQSFQAIIHNTLYLDRITRPRHVGRNVQLAHWLLVAILTGAVLLAAGRRRQSPIGEVQFFGCLVLLMALASPVCHLHYFSLALALAMATVASAWTARGAARLNLGWWSLFGALVLANTVPHLPTFDLTRDWGLAAYGVLLVWVIGLIQLWRRSRVLLRLPSDHSASLAAA
jgi:hypothetical protein